MNWIKAKLWSAGHNGIDEGEEKEDKDEEQLTLESKSKKRRKSTWNDHNNCPIFLSIVGNEEIFSVLERGKE